MIGGAGNDFHWGHLGNDTMQGGLGNDTYIVEQAGDLVQENPGEGNDTVYASVNYTLPANVEALFLFGPTAELGTGNALNNTIVGGANDETLNGGAGTDNLRGLGGNDTFLFVAGQANGDAVIDFAGNGAAAGDSLLFSGYGPGATFTQNDATHWQVNYNGGANHDVITFANAAAIHVSDYLFS
jgi:Ca2+-binding RTX toxin-like protein